MTKFKNARKNFQLLNFVHIIPNLINLSKIRHLNLWIWHRSVCIFIVKPSENTPMFLIKKNTLGQCDPVHSLTLYHFKYTYSIRLKFFKIYFKQSRKHWCSRKVSLKWSTQSKLFLKKQDFVKKNSFFSFKYFWLRLFCLFWNVILFGKKIIL